jgi:hypothetical protein
LEFLDKDQRLSIIFGLRPFFFVYVSANCSACEDSVLKSCSDKVICGDFVLSKMNGGGFVAIDKTPFNREISESELHPFKTNKKIQK